jgi:hypothetical protein
MAESVPLQPDAGGAHAKSVRSRRETEPLLEHTIFLSEFPGWTGNLFRGSATLVATAANAKCTKVVTPTLKDSSSLSQALAEAPATFS